MPAFAPGFRFSRFDGIILVLGGVAAIVAGMNITWVGFVTTYVVGHFFLFCNVFRISRPLELTWAAVFVVLAAATLIWQKPGWPLTVVVSLLVTVAVIVFEMRKPSYHGVAWRQVNPNLPAWWEIHAMQLTRV